MDIHSFKDNLKINHAVLSERRNAVDTPSDAVCFLGILLLLVDNPSSLEAPRKIL